MLIYFHCFVYLLFWLVVVWFPNRIMLGHFCLFLIVDIIIVHYILSFLTTSVRNFIFYVRSETLLYFFFFFQIRPEKPKRLGIPGTYISFFYLKYNSYRFSISFGNNWTVCLFINKKCIANGLCMFKIHVPKGGSCVHPHLIGIDWEDLKRDSGSSDPLSTVEK